MEKSKAISFTPRDGVFISRLLPSWTGGFVNRIYDSIAAAF
jgi:hypothetical protein